MHDNVTPDTQLCDLITPRGERPVHRYAPSPTGDLHLGNLRTALEARKAATAEGAIFILRIEDNDTVRAADPRVTDRIMDDLAWLGIDWDEGPDKGGPAAPYTQSRRGDLYYAALRALIARRRAYPCHCSRRSLIDVGAPHTEEGIIYPGTCRKNLATVRPAATADAAWRFLIDDGAVTAFTDDILGHREYRLDRLCGDFVIRRHDGLWAYQFACAIDDALMGVTVVTRGADLLTSTPRQIEILRALGLPIPRYRHIPLVAGTDGARMCKRDGSLSLRALRDRGMTRDDILRLIDGLPLMP